jgi:uncharacterized protein
MAVSKSDSRIEVRKSGIHGKGVYATRKIRKGTAIIEYTGERVSAREADRRYEDNPSTYLFTISRNVYIDGLSGGNEARLINHSCDPNCEAYLEDDRIMIHAIRKILPGEELCYDYQLSEEEDASTNYVCRCGALKCKGTMVREKKKKKKK